jgi:O-antigen/teichoic acid export membrane protein
MSIAKTIAKNTMYGSIQTGVDLITSFFLGIVLARKLGVELYGTYAYLIWLLSLGFLIIDLGLSEMSKRYIAEALGRGNRNDAVGLVRLTLVLRLAAAAVLALIMICVYRYLPGLSGSADSATYFTIIAVTLMPYGLTYAFMSIFRGFQKYEYSAFLSMTTSPLRLILTSVLLFMGLGLREVLIVQLATFCLGMVLGLSLLQRLVPLKELLLPPAMGTEVRKQAFRYAMTLLGIAIVSYLAQNQMATFFIERYCPVDQVGFFRLAGRLVTTPMTLLPTAFGFVLTPAVAEQYGKGNMEKIKKIYLTSARYLMLVAFPLEIGMIALASPIITLLYGAEYYPVINLMRFLLIPSAMAGIGYASGAIVYGTNKPGYVFKMNLLFAFVSTCLSLWLIPRYGVNGAVIVNLIPSIILTIVVIRYASKTIGTSWPMRDTVKIVLASSIMGLAVFGFQSQTGSIFGLAMGVPLGVVIYLVLIFVFRIVREEDLGMLKAAQGSLPRPARKQLKRLSRLIERIFIRTKFATGE